MKGVLLAAGIGKRLKPLTDHIPKPLIPVHGTPILEWIIRGLRDAGVTELAIITGHLAVHLETFFGDGSDLGVALSYHRQEVRNGTGYAVLPAESMLRNAPFFLGYGDILVGPGNYQALMNCFNAHSGDSVLSAWRVDDPSSCGALGITDGRLTDLVEKPAPGTAPSNLINAGLMILQPSIFDDIHALKPSPRGEYELTDALLSLARRTNVWVHELTGFWSDVGTHEKLAEAEAWFSSGERRIE